MGPSRAGLAAALAAAAAAAGAAGSADVRSPQPRIVFASDRGLAVSGEIHRIDAAGTHNLTRHPQVDRGAVPSPDGTKIAFSCVRERGGREVSGICLMNGDGTNQRLLVADGSGPTWAPDGSSIAYSAYDGEPRVFVAGIDGGRSRAVAVGWSPSWSPRGSLVAYLRERQLRVVDIDSGADRELAPGILAGAAVWSPDGTRVAFAGTSEGFRTGIFAARADGSRALRLTQPPGPCDTDGEPGWSPDGRAVVFSRDVWSLNGNVCAPDRSELFLVSGDSSSTEKLTTPPSGTLHEAPAWAPGGDEIAFVRSVRSGAGASPVAESGIYVIRLTGRGIRRAPTDPREWITGGPQWLPDRTILYSSSLRNDLDLFSVLPDGSGLRRLTDTQENEREPAASRDGTMLAFVRDGELVVSRVDGGRERRLTSTGAAGEPPAWSPDSKQIAFVREDGVHGLYVIDVATGAERLLVGGQTDARDPSWSPDGRRLAVTVSSRSDPDGSVGILELATGRVRRVGPSCTSAAEWSPDGRKLAATRSYCAAARGCPASIVVMRTDGSDVRSVSRRANCFSRPGWSPDGRKLVWNVGAIVVGEVATGTVRELLRGPGSVRNEDPVWLPAPPHSRPPRR